MGRHKSENPKCRSYRLRMTEEEFDFLTELSENTGLNKSQIVREGISLFLNYRWHPYPKEIPSMSGKYIVTIVDAYGDTYVSEELYMIEGGKHIGFKRPDYQCEDVILRDVPGIIAWMEYPLAYEPK